MKVHFTQLDDWRTALVHAMQRRDVLGKTIFCHLVLVPLRREHLFVVQYGATFCTRHRPTTYQLRCTLEPFDAWDPTARARADTQTLALQKEITDLCASYHLHVFGAPVRESYV